MKKKMGKALAVFVAALTLATACQKETTDTRGTMDDADIWGVAGTEKVLQDITTGYEDIRTDAKIDVVSARGEYEAGQLIITAKDKNLEYEVSKAALKNAEGVEFSVDNIEIFHEKYIEVQTNYESNGLPVGWYPDALVPVENVKAAGENTVAAGKNQGLYVRFNVPREQAAGVYSGTLTLTIGGKSKNIPVTLTVADVTVSEETHMQSHFGTGYSYFRGELDYSQTMYEKYVEKLFEYRISPGMIMDDVTDSDEDVEYYVELAYEYMQNPNCTTIDVPYGSATVQGHPCINKAYFKKFLTAFAEKSFETGYNMFDKLITRTGNLIDEPHGHGDGLVSRVEVVTSEWKAGKEEVALALEADSSITSPIKEEVIAGIRGLIDVVTTAYDEKYAPYVETWCPGYTEYDTEANRAKYDDQERRWFYGCVNPRAPYPTYKIDDTLLSARAIGWMQVEYDISGILYWATDLYQQHENGAYMDIEDYYGEDAIRYPRGNGDGFLLYPGKKYGIDGPVGSMRLEAIRDGVEDFELLYALKNAYKEKSESVNASADNVDFAIDQMIASMTESIYNGTRVLTTTETFQKARATLFELCMLQEHADAYLIHFQDDGYGNATYEFLVDAAAAVKVDGSALGASETITDGENKTYKRYVCTKALSETENYLNLSVESGDNVYNYERYLGGRVTVVNATQMQASDFTKEGAKPTYEAVADASTVHNTLSGALAKIVLPEMSAKESQSFRMGGALSANIDGNTQKAILHIYYEGEDEALLEISSKYDAKSVYYDLLSTTLKKGMNEITLTFPTAEWTTKAQLEYLAVYLGGNTGEPTRTLYVKDIILYAK
ncbi:MAG: DUF4091 domain-containing protein [Clostridia bacterium]|nr:DUF4091 domain-containing protein [Clostridia bacterium]